MPIAEVLTSIEVEAMQVQEELKSSYEELLNSKKKLPVIVYATDKSIKLLANSTGLDGFGGTVLSEMRCPNENSKFTAVKFADNSTRIIIAQ